MTGYQSKRAAAQDKLNDDDDTQVYGDALTIAYQSGYYDGKKAAQRKPTQELEARELASQFGSRMCDENGDTHGEELYCFSLDDIIAIKEALTQPEQKSASVTYQEVADAINELRGGTFEQRQIADEMENKRLYTAPPQRTWVDMTDDEISDIAINNPPAVHEFARAVLAKSKEKNGG